MRDAGLEGVALAVGEKIDGSGDGVEQIMRPCPLGLGKVGQHPAGHLGLIAWMTDPDAPAPKIAVQVRLDGAQPVIAGVTAAVLKPELAGRQIELIMKDSEGVRPQLVKAQGFAD